MSTANTRSSSASSLSVERAAWGRLWLVGLLTIVVSEVVNIVIATISVSFLSVPHTMQLQMPIYSFFTAIGALGAVLAFALINRLSRRPIQLYRIIASVVLVISFVPDFLLLSAPGSSTPAVIALIIMHIATYLVTVGMLTTMTRAK